MPNNGIPNTGRLLVKVLAILASTPRYPYYDGDFGCGTFFIDVRLLVERFDESLFRLD